MSDLTRYWADIMMRGSYGGHEMILTPHNTSRVRKFRLTKRGFSYKRVTGQKNVLVLEASSRPPPSAFRNSEWWRPIREYHVPETLAAREAFERVAALAGAELDAIVQDCWERDEAEEAVARLATLEKMGGT